MRANELYESAVEELKDKLPKLKSHTYNTIDRLMQDISVRHKITGKKLHDLFVHKYGHTPDTWIKKLKDRLEEQGVAEGPQEDAKFTPRLQIRSQIETALDQYLDPEKVAGAYTDIQYYKHDGKVYVEVLFNYTDGQKIGPKQRKQFLVNKDFTLTPIKKQGVAEGSNAGDIELSHSMSPDMLYVHATSDGTDVGGARFKKIDGAWTGDIVHVYPQFRRQGISTKIYDYAEDLVGKIIPSKTLKPKGKKFWDNRNNQGVAEEQHSCPHCGNEMVSEELMNEKKDACYYKVKSRYKVWPSAYASGALVKCRNKGADSWGNKSESIEEQVDENLRDWFTKEKWVRMDTKGNIKGPCAREPGEGKPKCLPQAKAHSLGKKGRASAAQRKRREDPNPERSGKAINVNTKKKTNESFEDQFEMKINQLITEIVNVNEDWNKVNKKDKTSGMSQKAVNAYRRENPGSKLKTAVTTKPSKLKPGSKAAKRRKSFCARMGGNKGPMKKPNGKPTPKALALRRWNCESVEEMEKLVMIAEQKISEAKNLKQQAAIAISKKKKQGVAEGLPQTLRKVVPGHAKREIDKKMDAGKFGKTDADKDANFQRYKKIQDKLKEFAPAPNPGGGNYLKALASAWYNGTFNTGDLHKGIKSQEDVEKILARGIHCGDGKVRKYEIGYNSDFDGVLITSDDYYNYSDYDDAGNEVDERTGKPWGPYEYVEFHDNDLDESVGQGVAESVQGPDELEQIKDFINWSMKTLNMQKPYPKFTLSRNTKQAQQGHHTGLHNGDRIWVYIENRNLVDIFRTIFHELVHHRQDQLGMIKDGDSYPGSPIEAMADMMAGKYIKIYGKEHPEIFQ